MDRPTNHIKNFYRSACSFEAGLIFVAVILGWLANINPFLAIRFSEPAILYGVTGTMPLFLLLVALEHMQIPSLAKVRRMLIDTLGPSLYGYHWTDWLILAALAGLSEELLFRGVLQPWLEASWGFYPGLIGSGLLFGLAHAVTPLYALLTALVGIYLSLSMTYGGENNLLIPVIIHGLYDFLAFIVLMRVYRSEQLNTDQAR